jgi:hypothetical protein
MFDKPVLDARIDISCTVALDQLAPDVAASATVLETSMVELLDGRLVINVLITVVLLSKYTNHPYLNPINTIEVERTHRTNSQ